MTFAAIGALLAGCGNQDRAKEEPSAMVDEWDAEQRKVLGAARFPIYVAEGVPMELGGWGHAPEGGLPPSHVRLTGVDEQTELSVDSDPVDEYEHDWRAEAADRVRDLDDPDAKAVSSTRSLRVDGVKLPFAFASRGEDWAAIARVGEVVITVSARGVDPDALHLRRLVDPLEVLSDTPKYAPPREAFDVLDPRRVRELTAGTPLEDSGPELAKAARPGLALLATDERSSSWIGGRPALPADMHWPTGAHGPMVFIAQLALADLDPKVWPGPREGHLHIFCAADESLGFEDEGACRVLHSVDAVEERDFPPDLHEYGELHRQRVEPSVGLTVPDRLGTDYDWEQLWSLRERLASEQGWLNSEGQLLGWPFWQNDDNLGYLAGLGGGEAADWTVLLQTGALDGELYVALPTADLAAGRFDRAEAIIEFD
ncbi:YwqG family protein [Solirubrobacter phytolaccae]|uniref:YwqG family protein n=1 Tax=Solirubrobacter phytolaccae TaxID=1404360 RepID=A0A9X3N8Z5_9ACTN|nr:DUF1963 domain-containing protein [Solirubrobacter phytolaccae]MDA0181651.1 YwqG family protein [Solirubrobacter phytolaccae]